MPISEHVTLVAGDVVLVRATVRYASKAGDSTLTVQSREYGETMYVERGAAEIVSTRIEVGDEVRPTRAVNGPSWETQEPGIVKAIIDDQGWVAWAGGDNVCALACLHRVRTRAQVAEGEARPEERAGHLPPPAATEPEQVAA